MNREADYRVRLAEALVDWADQLPGTSSKEAAGDLLVDAARRLLAGETVCRCATHNADFLEKTPDDISMCVSMLYEDAWNTLPEPEPCKPVSKLLLDPPGEGD